MILLLDVFLQNAKWFHFVHKFFFFFLGYIHLKSLADNGGGMNPDKIRDCVSLGFSRKSQIANTIGQCMKLESNQSAFGFLSFSNNHVGRLFIQMEMVLKQVP